jgi:hypothetical protein
MSTKRKERAVLEPVESLIREIRGERVILGRHFIEAVANGALESKRTVAKVPACFNAVPDPCAARSQRSGP